MINLSDLIEECKNQICHKANMAGIRFLEEDLISVREQDTTVVFLKRQLLGYKQDENDNYILDENGNKIPYFKNLIWIDAAKPSVKVENGIMTVTSFKPTIRALTPWLIYLIDDEGNTKTGEHIHYDNRIKVISPRYKEEHFQ